MSGFNKGLPAVLADAKTGPLDARHPRCPRVERRLAAPYRVTYPDSAAQMGIFDSFRKTSSQPARPSRPQPPARQSGLRNSAPAVSSPLMVPEPASVPASAACLAILSRVKELEAIPGLAAGLLKVLDDPNSSGSAISSELRKDQGLMALVLRTANSSYYGSSGHVRDLTEAAVVLGLDTLRQLVLGRLSRLVLRKNDPLQKTLWRHALATAVAAEGCARSVKGVTVAHAFTGGLLHDLGKAVLSEAAPEAYADAWEVMVMSEHDRPADEIER